MKEGTKMTRRIISIAIVLIIAFTLAACGGGGGSTPAPSTGGSTAPAETKPSEPAETQKPAAQPITLKLSGAFPEGGAHYYYFDQFCKSVNEYSNGTLNVVWGHGPEAIPANELAEAMVNDVVELVFTPCTYLVSHMPVLAGVKLIDVEEARKNGGVEYINELTEKGLNAHFLARASDGVAYTISVNKKINTLDDFKGLTIRGTNAHTPLLKALGAGVVSMPQGEIYNALEKNVIDGAGGVLTDIVDNSLQEVLKYLILPGFYTSDSSLFVALGTWNKLDQVQKDALTKAAIDWEVDSKKHNTAIAQDVIKTITEAGMEVIELQGEMREKWLKLAYDGAWAEVEAADPEIAKKMRSFTSN
jgi:TRAP-type C4-dicarboxylate transport system substrate-binding protein